MNSEVTFGSSSTDRPMTNHVRMTTDRVEMPRLSYRSKWWYWYLFSCFGTMLGSVGVFVWILVKFDEALDSSALVFIPLIFLVNFAYLCALTKLLFEVVEEVFDAGDGLLIRNGCQEERIALSEIMKVRCWTPRFIASLVVLTLRRPSIFGTRVVFLAPEPTFTQSFMPLKMRPVMTDLLERIDAAQE
jgi:hypothetical protein